MRLIAGLGNPGEEYRFTRHNMGFWLADRLSREEGLDFSRQGFDSLWGRGRIGGQEVILAKPQTFMNRSGEAVSRLLRFFKILPEDLIVLHDDLDLPPGKIRIRVGGGDGGHLGVKSIMEALASGAFIRVKVGIGRPFPNWEAADYVLAKLSQEEREDYEKTIARGVEAVLLLLNEGPEKAMNQFN